MDSSRGRSRLALCLFSIVLIAVVATSARAQGPFGGLPDLPSLGGEGVQIVPRVRVGFEQIGMNVNLPIPRSTLSWILERNGIDLSLRNAEVWVGSVGVYAGFYDRVGVELTFLGNAKRNVEVSMPDNPFGNWNISQLTVNPLIWKGTQLELWSIDGRVSYNLRSDVAAVVGYRVDKISLGLRDPSDARGQLAAMWASGAAPDFFGDVQVMFWLPYFGVRLAGANYRASLVGSPFVPASVKIPLTLIANVPFIPGAVSQETTNYSINKLGVFLEAEGEYQMQPMAGLALGLWGRANLLRVRDDGFAEHLQGPIPIQPNPSDSQSGTATIGTYMVSGGISATIPF